MSAGRRLLHCQDTNVWPHVAKPKLRSSAIAACQSTAYSAHHPTGDIFVICLKMSVSFLKMRSVVSSAENNLVAIPVTSRSEFSLTPLCEEGAKADEAIRSWEGEYESVTAFYQSRKGQDMPMPAVSEVHTDTCLQMTTLR